MHGVAPLRHSEPVTIDRERLLLLVLDLGEARAHRVVARALEEIASRLLSVETGWAEGDFARVVRTAQSLVSVADQIGMHLVAHVACDVAAVARQGDAPALAATVARLQRVGDRSLAAICGARGVSL